MAVIGAVWLYFWKRFRDPFHPLIIILPQFAFLYGYMPLQIELSDHDRFWLFVGGDSIYYYHAISLFLISSLVAGTAIATNRVTKSALRWDDIQIKARGFARRAAWTLGFLGMVAWLYTISSSGGLAEAYGTAYGGGSVNSGYIREMRFIGILGVPVIYLLRSQRGMRKQDWMLVALCAAPTLLHAGLGARRGPAFVGLMFVIGGYFYLLRRRVSLTALLVAAGVVGFLMLFLVANRSSIYLGSSASDLRNPLEFLIRWQSNEYLIGGAVVRYSDSVGSFYGTREFAWLIGRFLPPFVWPSVYSDLPVLLGIDVNIWVNGGVSPEGIAGVTNWTPSRGSAEGFVGSLWLEFGWVAPVVAFLIGFLFGTLWKRARTSLAPRLVYLLSVSLSVYLVMQSLDPWLYRLILLGVPAYFIARFSGASPPRSQRLGLSHQERPKNAPPARSSLE